MKPRPVAVSAEEPCEDRVAPAAAVCDQLADLARRIAEVAEMARPGRTGADAGRDAVHLGQVVVVDPVDAEGAFLHHPGQRVELAGAVGADAGAEAAAHAMVLVHEHDAVVGALVGGACRANGGAGRVVAMQAGLGEVDELRRACRRRHL